MQKTKILITGATGFIGRNLLKKLTKNYKIKCLVRSSRIRFSRDVEKILGDITNENSLKGIAKDIDCVIHLAALKQGDKHNLVEVNVKGTQNLVRNSKNVKHFIYISTEFVESFDTPYTRTKKLGEDIVKKSGINYTILRLPHLYGEREGFLNSKLFILSYKRVKEITGVKFISEPKHVDKVFDAIEKIILTKEYYKKTVNLEELISN